MLWLAETRHNGICPYAAAVRLVPIFLIPRRSSKRFSLSREYCCLGPVEWRAANDWSASSARLPLADGAVHGDGAHGLRARRSVIRPFFGNVQIADWRWQS